MAPLSDEHIPAVAAALHRLEVDHSRYPFPIKPNLTKAIQHVIEKGLAGEAYVGHGCLLLFSVQEPWYSDTAVLCEEFILAIEPNANPRAVIKFLDQQDHVKVRPAVVGPNCPKYTRRSSEPP